MVMTTPPDTTVTKHPAVTEPLTTSLQEPSAYVITSVHFDPNTEDEVL